MKTSELKVGETYYGLTGKPRTIRDRRFTRGGFRISYDFAGGKVGGECYDVAFAAWARGTGEVDPRDAEIAALKARIAELEAK